MGDPSREQVLVLPRTHFERAGLFRGFRPWNAGFFGSLLEPTQFRYLPRGDAEANPDFQQLIPYVVLRHAGEVFHYRRGAGGSEARLRARRSVGVGGHVQDIDGPAAAALHAGMLRELREEVSLPALQGPPRPLGLIYDDRTPVGAVHLGVVYLAELASAEVRPREADVTECGFAPPRLLLADRDGFETWSQFVLDALTTGQGL